MKACAFCAEKIQDAAIVCRFCNRTVRAIIDPTIVSSAAKPLPRGVKRLFWGGGIALVGLYITAFLLVTRGGLSPTNVTRLGAERQVIADNLMRDTSKVNADVAFLKTQGLLHRFDVDFSEAFVSGFMWAGVDVEAKKGIMATFSAHFKHAGKPGQVKVSDAQSGRTLAEFSVWSGYVFH